ncbi:hypothetical protein AB9E28_34885, partial [Rhizobium leguminosarum]
DGRAAAASAPAALMLATILPLIGLRLIGLLIGLCLLPSAIAAGRLGDIVVSKGAFLRAGAAIVNIAKYDQIYVKFHLQERYLRELK